MKYILPYILILVAVALFGPPSEDASGFKSAVLTTALIGIGLCPWFIISNIVSGGSENKQQIERLNKKSARDESQITSLKKQLSESRQKASPPPFPDLSERMAQVESELREAHNRAESLQENLRLSEEQNVHLNGKVHDLEDAISTAEASPTPSESDQTPQARTQDIQLLEENLAHSEAEKQNLQERYSILEKRLEKISQESPQMEALSVQIGGLEREKQSLTSDLSKTSEQLSKTEKAKTEAEGSLEQAKMALTSAKEQSQQQIASKNQELQEARNGFETSLSDQKRDFARQLSLKDQKNQEQKLAFENQFEQQRITAAQVVAQKEAEIEAQKVKYEQKLTTLKEELARELEAYEAELKNSPFAHSARFLTEKIGKLRDGEEVPLKKNGETVTLKTLVDSEAQAVCLDLFLALKELFKEKEQIPLDDLESVSLDVQRINQIGIVMKVLSQKIMAAQQDETLTEEIRDMQVAQWQRIIDSEFAQLEGA